MVDPQRAFCLERGIECQPTHLGGRVGYALSTGELQPLNGLRHPAENHVCERHLGLLKLLGLPPGYRFLLAPGYLDVWFDAALLLLPEEP